MLSWHLGELSEEVSAGLFTEKKFSAGGELFFMGKMSGGMSGRNCVRGNVPESLGFAWREFSGVNFPRRISGEKVQGIIQGGSLRVLVVIWANLANRHTGRLTALTRTISSVSWAKHDCSHTRWVLHRTFVMRHFLRVMLHSTQLVKLWSRDCNHEFTTCEWNAIFNREVLNVSCMNQSLIHEFTSWMEYSIR